MKDDALALQYFSASAAKHWELMSPLHQAQAITDTTLHNPAIIYCFCDSSDQIKIIIQSHWQDWFAALRAFRH